MIALVAKPRGFCAGVERAIRTVELALERYGAPVYVRKEIVHNSHVVKRLGAMGVKFIDELDEAPEGATAILSAHGSPPEVYEQARRRGLRLIDATCPLVTKVHLEVRRYAARGCKIILIGHAGHDEVVGTTGEAPEHVVLVERLEDAEKLDLPTDTRGVILTQTTLSQDDTREIIDRLQTKYPRFETPLSEDICYATQNRQNAVKELTDQVDLLLVVGSPNSSNSLRLTEVAKSRGVGAQLIDGPEDIRAEWLAGVEAIGVTSGASAPEEVVRSVLDYLASFGFDDIRELEAPEEGVSFRLPAMDIEVDEGRR